MEETIADRVDRLSRPNPGRGRPKLLEPPRTKVTRTKNPSSPYEEFFAAKQRTPSGGGARWEKRRAKGGKYNEPPIRPDGTFPSHAVREDSNTGCLIWQLSLIRNSKTGTPQAVISGRHVSVRRELWRIHRGEPIPRSITTSCFNPRCVNHHHLASGLPSQLTQQRIVSSIRDGATREEVRGLGVSTQSERTYFRLAERDIPPFPARPDWARGRYESNRLADADRPPGVSERNWSIFLRVRNATLGDVGREFGISRERVRQIANVVALAIQENQEGNADDSVSASVEMGAFGGSPGGEEGDHEARGLEGTTA